MKKYIHTRKSITALFKKISYLTVALSFIPACVLANNQSEVSVDQVVNDINTGGGVYATIREIIGVLGWTGLVVAVLKMAQIGIMFMLSAGKSKSDAKAALMPWLVGALVCVMFGTVGPWVINMLMSGSGGGVFDI